jgi:hypothetical protein
MTKNTKKLPFYEKSQFFDQKSLNWSILAKTLRIFLRFFSTMVQIKTRNNNMLLLLSKIAYLGFCRQFGVSAFICAKQTSFKGF